MILGAGARSGTIVVDPEPASVPYLHPGVAPFNPPHPMVTPTTTSGGGTVHPSVHDFYPGTWCGWRYWMAITDFGNNGVEGGASGAEDPWVMVSADGYNWQSPVGITNPISTVASQAIITGEPGGINTDTELCFDPTTATMHIWWREGVGGPTRCWHTYSTDGVTWATPSITFATPSDSWVSPTVVRMPGGAWRMWTWVRSGAGTPGLRTAASPDGPWSEPATVAGMTGWHGDVILLDGRLLGMVDGRTFALSADGLAVTWGDVALSATAGSWDVEGIYRCTIQPHPGGKTMRVWYSTDGTRNNRWQTGYTAAPRELWPAP